MSNRRTRNSKSAEDNAAINDLTDMSGDENSDENTVADTEVNNYTPNDAAEMTNRKDEIIADLGKRIDKLEDVNRVSEQRIRDLENDNQKLKSKNDELEGDKDALAQELEKTKEFLCDEKALSADLLNRLDDSSLSSSATLPSLLLVTDNEDFANALADRPSNWKTEVKICKSIKDIADDISNDTNFSNLTRFDKILLLLGTTEMLQNEDGHRVANNIVRLTKLITEKLNMPVAIVQHPPMRDQKKFTAVTLMNSRLQRQLLSGDINKCEVISIQDKCNSHLKSQLIQDDGYSLTSLGLKIVLDAVADQLIVEVRDKPDSKSNCAHHDENIQEAVAIPDEVVGAIIGNKGSNIRTMQNKTDTQITIVQILKRDKKAYMALVMGDSQGRQAAKEEINTIIKNAEKSDSGKRAADSDSRPSKFNK